MPQPTAALLVLLNLFFTGPAIIDLPAHRVLRFVVTGDAGATHSQLRQGIINVNSQTPLDGILLVGDNFYPCGISGLADPQWTKITWHFGPSGLPIYPILGNHDYGDQQEEAHGPYSTCGQPNPGAEVAATGTIPQWHFPARNYLLRSPLADLAMLDTQPIALGFAKKTLGSATAREETSWLAATLDHMESHWRIVVGHHTIYSSGMHGRTNDGPRQRMRALMPILRDQHVDLYVCGHDHDMELIGDLQHESPVFLVSGAGSGLREMRPRRADDGPSTVYPEFPAKPYIGFAVLEISNDHLAITFHDRSGTRTAGPYLISKHE